MLYTYCWSPNPSVAVCRDLPHSVPATASRKRCPRDARRSFLQRETHRARFQHLFCSQQLLLTLAVSPSQPPWDSSSSLQHSFFVRASTSEAGHQICYCPRTAKNGSFSGLTLEIIYHSQQRNCVSSWAHLRLPEVVVTKSVQCYYFNAVVQLQLCIK